MLFSGGMAPTSLLVPIRCARDAVASHSKIAGTRSDRRRTGRRMAMPPEGPIGFFYSFYPTPLPEAKGFGQVRQVLPLPDRTPCPPSLLNCQTLYFDAHPTSTQHFESFAP